MWLGGAAVGFGARLRRTLKLRDMTQRELARLLDVGESTVSQWVNESREPDFDTQRRIADILRVSLDYLAGRTDDMSAPHHRSDPPPELPTNWRERVARALADAGWPEDRIREFIRIGEVLQEHFKSNSSQGQGNQESPPRE